MNLQLIAKLVKLANNNPNDNEANLAARKVCKLIEEGNFVYKEDKEPERVQQNPFSGFTEAGPYNYSGFNPYRSGPEQSYTKAKYKCETCGKELPNPARFCYDCFVEQGRKENEKKKESSRICTRCGRVVVGASTNPTIDYVCGWCWFNETYGIKY